MSMWPTVLLTLTAGYMLLILSFLLGFLRMRNRDQNRQASLPFISVIIPARNEAQTIEQCLESIFRNDYPADNFEVIVVDDLSTDDTSRLVEAFARSVNTDGQTRLRLLHIPENVPRTRAHKKRAVTRGIAHAQGSLIVTTDADCVVPPSWLSAMASRFEDDIHMVSGPVAFFHRGWWQRIMALEYFGLMMAGAGAIGLNRPVVCSAASLAYRKTTFDALGGFRGLDHLTSGDDDLLMQKMANEYPGSVTFCTDPRAMVWTHPPASFRELLEQRKRWASKGARYPRPVLVASLVMLYLFFVALAGTGIASIFYPSLLPYFLGAWAGKSAAEFALLYPACRHFRLQHLLWAFPVAQLLHVPYILYAGWAGTFFSYRWKDREIVQ